MFMRFDGQGSSSVFRVTDWYTRKRENVYAKKSPVLHNITTVDGERGHGDDVPSSMMGAVRKRL